MAEPASGCGLDEAGFRFSQTPGKNMTYTHPKYHMEEHIETANHERD
jgi:hypothetical protein